MKLTAIDPKFLILALIIVFTSCTSDPAGDNMGDAIDMPDEDLTEEQKQDKERAESTLQQVFKTVPSPVELVTMVKNSGATFRGELLNDPNNKGKYLTKKMQAMNLGVYGADLSYACIFSQTQSSIFYLASCEDLSKQLGISGAFDQSLAARLEANIENKDSLLHIVSDAYWESDAYLKESKRHTTAALIIAGGWLEALYISTQLVSENPTQAITERIAEQKLSLANLVDLLHNASDGSIDIKDVIADFEGIYAAYDGVVVGHGKNTVVEEGGKTTIKSTSDIQINDEQLKAITDKIAEVRNKYIKG